MQVEISRDRCTGCPFFEDQPQDIQNNMINNQICHRLRKAGCWRDTK